MNKIVMISVVAGLVACSPMNARAVTGALCIKTKGTGTIKVRSAGCKSSEVQVGSFDTDAPQASLNPQDISARLTIAAPVSVPDVSLLGVPFGAGSETYDTAALHDEVVNPERLTAPVAGKYLVYGFVGWNSDNNDGTYRYASIRVNGTAFTDSVVSSSVPPMIDAAQQSLSTHVNLAAGDYLGLYVYHDAGYAVDADFAVLGMVKVP